MDVNKQWLVNTKIKKTMENLQNNNMEAYFVKDSIELIERLKELIPKDAVVSVGGSVTLAETGVLDFIRSGGYNFLNRYKEGMSKDEIKKIYRQSFFADAYITSTNALTENGELYNVDGNGNRVAAMIYGPDRVIVVAGINKIVRDIEEAKIRVKEVAAPANAKRLIKNTPCSQLGNCIECDSPDRICSDYVIIGKQNIKNRGRIKVIIVNEDLGY